MMSQMVSHIMLPAAFQSLPCRDCDVESLGCLSLLHQYVILLCSMMTRVTHTHATGCVHLYLTPCLWWQHEIAMAGLSTLKFTQEQVGLIQDATAWN